MSEIILRDYQRTYKPAFVCEFHPVIHLNPRAVVTL